MSNFLNISDIIDSMQNEPSITALIPAENIFDNLPSEEPETNYLIINGAISQRNKLCNKTNRVSLRFMSGTKDGGTFPVLRNIYNTVNSFLVGDNKKFGNTEVYLIDEQNYFESNDELGKNTIINDYFFNFVK